MLTPSVSSQSEQSVPIQAPNRQLTVVPLAGNIQKIINNLITDWKAHSTLAIVRDIERLREAARENPDTIQQIITTLNDRQAWLLSAMILTDRARRLPDDPLVHSEIAHQSCYMAARNPDAAEWVARNQDDPLLTVAASRYTLYNGDIRTAKDQLGITMGKPDILQQYPEAKLLELELFIKMNDLSKAQEILSKLQKDESEFPAWMTVQICYWEKQLKKK
jgi:hypothetical protein